MPETPPSQEAAEDAPKKVAPLPRNSAADSFEQNPLAHLNERLPENTLEDAQSVDGVPEDERVREAVRRVIQDGVPISVVAKQLHLSANSIRNWKSRYSSFLEEHAFGESNPSVGAAEALISDETKTKFSQNWSSLLDETHASEADFKQDPLEVFMQTSSGTSWMYDEDGKVERFTVLGVLVAFLGVAAVMIFLTADKNDVADAKDFEYHSSLNDQPIKIKLRYDLDVDRAGEVVQKFFHADGYLAKLAFLRDSESVMPIVKEFYSRHSDAPVTDAIQTYGMVGHGLVSVAFEVPSQQANIFFNLVPHENSYQIDWMTSTLYQHEHLEEFINSKSSKPTLLHVQIVKGNYYNYGWSDSEKYQCYNITFPGLKREICGYVLRDTDLAAELLGMTAMEQSHAAIIEAKFPEHPQDSRQVEIVKLVSKDWLPY